MQFIQAEHTGDERSPIYHSCLAEFQEKSSQMLNAAHFLLFLVKFAFCLCRLLFFSL